jgi:hypothetical protein
MQVWSGASVSDGAGNRALIKNKSPKTKKNHFESMLRSSWVIVARPRRSASANQSWLM